MLKFLRKHYRIILVIGSLFGLFDSLMTNWLINRGASELNPVVSIIAGTYWLIVIKMSFPLIMLGIIEIVKWKTNYEKI